MKAAILLAASICVSGVARAQDSVPPLPDEAKFAQVLKDGTRLVKEGKPAEAIQYFDQVASAYEDAYRDRKEKLYCARSRSEAMTYVLMAANTKADGRLVSCNWAYAYFLKAFALLDQQQFAQARELLGRAISLAPRNAQFLDELGSVYQREKNWPMALQTFQSAESAAREFSEPTIRNAELSRAWRGMGYVFVEQGRLDEAEKMYRLCLQLDKNDARALNELRYVEREKSKRR